MRCSEVRIHFTSDGRFHKQPETIRWRSYGITCHVLFSSSFIIPDTSPDSLFRVFDAKITKIWENISMLTTFRVLFWPPALSTRLTGSTQLAIWESNCTHFLSRNGLTCSFCFIELSTREITWWCFYSEQKYTLQYRKKTNILVNIIYLHR